MRGHGIINRDVKIAGSWDSGVFIENPLYAIRPTILPLSMVGALGYIPLDMRLLVLRMPSEPVRHLVVAVGIIGGRGATGWRRRWRAKTNSRLI